MANILIIEDEALLRHVIVVALSVEGHRVVQATNGREALVSLKVEAPDLVITDLFMPECDGLEVITTLRESHPATPVLAISGHSTRAGLFLNMAERLGAQRTLEKPFSVGELLSAVNEVLAQPVRLTP